MPNTPFKPTLHGFNFANTLADISPPDMGVCGGMTYASLDYYHAGKDIPDFTAKASIRLTLGQFIWARQCQSVWDNGAKHWALAWNPSDDQLIQWSTGPEWDKVKHTVDVENRPVPIGLITMDRINVALNHQVVLVGYSDAGGAKQLHCYDPNLPNQTTTFTFDGRNWVHSANYKWRGFFVETPYLASRLPAGITTLIAPFRNGTLVKGSGPEVYVIGGGGKLWIPNEDEFNALGYRWNEIFNMDDGYLNATPDYPEDGTLLVQRTDPTVAVVFGGYPFRFPSEESFLGMGFTWDRILVVPDGAFSRLPTVPETETLLMEYGDPKVYRFIGGQLRWVTNEERFNELDLSWPAIRTVPSGSLAGIPMGTPL